MKCTPQKTMNSASRLRRHHRKLIRIARQVGMPDNIVTLIMMAEDDDTLPKFASRAASIRSRDLGVRHDQIIF